MQIRSSTHDGVVVLSLDGDVLGGPDGSALHDALAAVRGDAPLQVVVDLEGVRFMNSSGLGMLVGALTTARNTGGDLRLAAVDPKVMKVLQLSGFTSILRLYDDVDAAVARYAA